MQSTYHYKGHLDLSDAELLFWIAVDKTLEQLGIEDTAAVFAILSGQPVIPARGKFQGATKGTSLASIASRRLLNYDLKFRLPMITGPSLSTLRIALTRNLGAFVGRTVPIFGWALVAYDVSRIMWNTVATYNAIVPVDRHLSSQ